MTADISGALRIYAEASEYATKAGCLDEVEWQRNVIFEEFSETDFLRETAWVILCSGFREKIVRRVFDHISLCFCDWESSSAILDADPYCRVTAMGSFRSPRKLRSIVDAARYVNERRFDNFKLDVLADPYTELQKIPYIGVITVWHLAKNLGLDVAKPDRHLARISSGLGFEDAAHFCREISRLCGEQQKVVDLIVWRYLADNPRVLPLFEQHRTSE